MSTQMLTMGQVSDRLHLSLTATKRLIYDGQLASVKIGRSRRVRETDLEAFIAERLTATTGEVSR